MDRPRLYKLDGHNPVPAVSVEWGPWFESADRRVAHSVISHEVDVSTIFIGIDHNFTGEGPPILFETLVRGGPENGDQRRYATWDEAEAGHAEVVAALRGAPAPAEPKPLDPRIDGYDWECAFLEAALRSSPAPVLGSTVSAATFTREDVAEVLATSDGDNDGPDWIGLFRLNDGRFAMVRAGCDFTGWDCQAGGRSEVAATAEELERLALSDEERGRLGFARRGPEPT